MCGISGCVNNKSAMVAVKRSLNKLQNRGYDSAGICTFKKNKWYIKKYVSDSKKNAIESINSDPMSDMKCDIAIGHTRWATHGAKTLENAHPHHDDQYRFTMIHNGIIENYLELKQELVANGYTFYGESDTEIIVKYLDFIIKKGYDYYHLMKFMEGSWAILLMDKLNPDKLYFMKNGSPLIIGFDNNNSKIMCVSEFIGFNIDITTYFIVDDHEYGYINISNGVCHCNSSNKHLIQKMPDISSELSPNPYLHWTIKEINDQSNALNNLIQTRCGPNKLFFPELDAIQDDLLNTEHIIFLACGTSYHAAQIGARFFKELRSNTTVEVIDGSDFDELDIPPNRKVIMILLSQSGETRDLYRTLIIGKRHKIRTIGIINVENSLIAREVDICLYLKAGREHAVASTKSFTNQVVMLLMFALWMNQKNQFASSQKYFDALANVSLEFQEITIKAVSEVPNFLPLFKDKQDCFILGKHFSEWIAKEASLKIKEISYIHSEGFAAAALKHGPFALLTDGTPVILLVDDDRFVTKMENIASEVKSRLVKTLCITNKMSIGNNIDHLFYYETDSVLFPLLAIVPLQILAYHLSIDRGNNPDYPRNLAKVVTVD